MIWISSDCCILDRNPEQEETKVSLQHFLALSKSTEHLTQCDYYYYYYY